MKVLVMEMIKGHISILFISFLMLQSCGFKQDMRTYQDTVPSVIETALETNVGLVVPRPMFRKEVHAHGTHIRLYPGFYETIKHKYQGLFKSIRMVGADEVDSSYDVLIEANCDVLSDNELFFTARIFNTDNISITLQKGEPIATISELRAATYLALTFTIIGAPLAFNHSNSENERRLHNALVSILENIKADVYASVDTLSRKPSEMKARDGLTNSSVNQELSFLSP